MVDYKYTRLDKINLADIYLEMINDKGVPPLDKINFEYEVIGLGLDDMSSKGTANRPESYSPWTGHDPSKQQPEKQISKPLKTVPDPEPKKIDHANTVDVSTAQTSPEVLMDTEHFVEGTEPMTEFRDTPLDQNRVKGSTLNIEVDAAQKSTGAPRAASVVDDVVETAARNTDDIAESISRLKGKGGLLIAAALVGGTIWGTTAAINKSKERKRRSNHGAGISDQASQMHRYL